MRRSEPIWTAGRREELGQIRSLVSAVSGGAGRVLVFAGEAGIGKSHLCGVAVDLATEAGIVVVETSADDLEQDRPGRLLDEARSRIEPHAGEIANGPSTPRPDGGDPAYRTIERFVDAVERTAASRPLLIVAEDLHWSDDPSLRGLATLIRSIDRLPCGLVATMRRHPRPDRIDAFESAVEQVGGRIVGLAGLAPPAVEELVARHLGAVPGGNFRSVLAGAAGNPFMLEEIVRAVTDGDRAENGGGVVEVAAGVIPHSVHEVLLRRLRSLSASTADTLRHASLLGRGFTATEVAAIGGVLVVDALRAFEEAAAAGMVVSAGDQHRFRHDLVREAVYQSIPSATRWDLHRAVAIALIQLDAPAMSVAHHFAAGARPGDLDAVRWLRRAAAEAVALDTGSAAELLQRALSLAPHEWSERFGVEAELVELLAWAGRIDEAARRGQSLVDRALDDDQRFLALQALGAVRSSAGDLRLAAEDFSAAAATGNADNATAAQLRCAAAGMSVIAGVETTAGARSEANRHLDSARGDVVCWARNTLAVAAVCEGAYDELIDHARVAAALLEDRYVRPLGFLIPHAWLSTGLQYLDRYDEARVTARRARDRAEQRGDVGLLVQVMAGTCGVTWALGEWDDTVAELEAVSALAEDTGVVAQTVLIRAISAQIATERDQPDRAAEHLAAAEAFLASGTPHLFGLEILALERARGLAGEGDVDGAAELLGGVWDATVALRGLIQWRLVGPALVRLCMAAGRRDRAASGAAEIGLIARRSSAPSASATARRADGLAHGDAAMLVSAADAYLATPRRTESASTCEDAVLALLETGAASPDMKRLLEAADEVYVQAGASNARRRIHSMREAAGLDIQAAPRAATFGWESLTRKERDVVALVSRGMSNPEIAAEMFISRRTVEAHLSHVFRKLAVSNRTQLAREAIERGEAGVGRSTGRGGRASTL
ncbi:LuxR family transcriptional regulator [soil metagenome]